MDDLPTKMCAVPQIEGRIHEWSYFEEYSIGELFEILRELHPHFAGLNLENPVQYEQVEFIYQKFGGVPGEVVPFLRRLDYREEKLGGGIDLRLLKAVYLSTQRDKERALDSSIKGYVVKADNAGNKAKDTKNGSRKKKGVQKAGNGRKLS
jgi:hypothetical protein